ncbi:aspartate aminotransferase family protein [Emcibacter nanhaiensis]|uniref:Acetylornithine aminotransferase n=1 Tax=Emcibacter nanhaiensis TaxID=1505037 RepID=A0A501PBL3_9PROT|nr:aspartate aminotransferase family protein [Emcibacter nanhaiensis]TPD57392.1 aspartate aminotransferase family protein [Emcibacter nanhaiensis]
MKNSQSDNTDQSFVPPVLPTYARADVAFVRGEGVYAYDAQDNRYLDFGSGIGVNNLGFCHPALVKALTEQAGKIWHTSNLYRIEGQERLAERLTRECFADSMFFTNSGAEAMECAIKMARKFHDDNGDPDRFRIITFEGCFHGRTLATIAAAGSEKLIKGFGPMPDGFDHVPFYKDMSKVEEHITEETAAILIEPVQGEGGIRPVSRENLEILRKLCDKHGILLMFDEVQCGMGRTGKLFAYQHSAIKPDILATAKGIGGGFPLGACMATDRVAQCMKAGTHGSTYGGNPLAMAVGNAVLDVVLADGFMEHVDQMSYELRKALVKLGSSYPDVIDVVRGKGLMLGLKLHTPVPDFVGTALKNGLMLVGAADNTVRLLPPLIVTEEQVEEAIGLLDKTCTDLKKALDAKKADSDTGD